MLGFIVGTACLIGLVKVIRGGRRWRHAQYGYGCGAGGCGNDGCGADFGGGCGGGFGARRHGWHGHRHGFGGPFGGGRFGGPFGGGPFGGGRRGWGGFDDDDNGGGFGGGPGPVLLRGLFERLQATPAQEKVIAEALKELRAAFKKSAEEKAKGAKQVAEALRGDEFKTENMGEAFSHLDSSSETVRDAMFTALARIHDVLDERQRKILADLVGRGGRALENLAEQA